MTATKGVLLVEDNRELRELYKDAFSRSNYTVFEAEDGEGAVKLTLAHQPDAILLDLMLPHQGGLGVLRMLRDLPECQDTPIIILTSLPNPEYKAKAGGQVQGYFIKTEVTPKVLVEKVSQLIG